MKNIAFYSVILFGIPVIIYGVLCFRNPDKSSLKCWVVSDDDKCLTHEEAKGEGIDMTSRFQNLALAGFVLSSFTFVNMIWT